MSGTTRPNHWVSLKNVRRKDQCPDCSTCNSTGCTRLVEVRVIEHIEELSTNLHLHPVGELDELRYRHIPVVEARSTQNVAPHIAERKRLLRSHDRASHLV